jgi:DNA-binding transcriptional regulator YhcF (GntR family)
VRAHLVDEIAIGQYPPGTYLPSVRELAKTLGVNRNTVSKVYLELRRDGVLESVHGLGVRVVRPGDDVGDPAGELAHRIETVVRHAYQAGIGKDSLLASVAGIATETYESLSVRIALVECARRETEELAQEVSKHLSLEIDAVVLSDLVDDPAEVSRRYDVVSTTFFHLQEVTEALAGLPPAVVGMNHVVSHESILRIARLKPDTRVGVVCENDRTLALVRGIVQLYVKSEVRGATRKQLTDIARLATQVDVIVDHSRTHDVVSTAVPGLPIITVKFHIEEQSIEFLRQTALTRAGDLGERVLVDAR